MKADGLWSESEAFYDLCEVENIIPVIDPLMWEEDEPLPKGAFAYWKIMGGQGLSVRLSEYDLDKLLDLADQWFANQDQASPYKLWANFTSPKMILSPAVGKICFNPNSSLKMLNLER